MRTLQELFNLAYLGLEKQGWLQSGEKLGGEFQCLYLDSEGNKCAIGHCIPDINRHKNQTWFANSVISVPREVLDTSVHVSALLDLQYCHDNSFSPAAMQQSFIEYANRYNLEVPNEKN